MHGISSGGDILQEQASLPPLMDPSQQGGQRPSLATVIPLEILHMILPHLVSPQSLADFWHLACSCKRLYTQLWDNRYYTNDTVTEPQHHSVAYLPSESWSVILRVMYDPVEEDDSFYNHLPRVNADVSNAAVGISREWHIRTRDMTIVRRRLEFFQLVSVPIEKRDHTHFHSTANTGETNDAYYSFGHRLDISVALEMSAQHVRKNLQVLAKYCAEENWSFFLSQSFLVGISTGKNPNSVPLNWPSMYDTQSDDSKASEGMVNQWRSCIISEMCHLIAQLASQDVMVLTSIHENEYRSMEWLAGVVFDRLAYSYDSLQLNHYLLRWPILLVFQILFCGSIGSTIRAVRQSMAAQASPSSSSTASNELHHQVNKGTEEGQTTGEPQHARTTSTSSITSSATTRRRNWPRTHYVPIWFNSANERHTSARRTIYQRVVPIPLIPPPLSRGIRDLYRYMERVSLLSKQKTCTPSDVPSALNETSKDILEKSKNAAVRTMQKTTRRYRLSGRQWRGFYAYQELEIVNGWPRDEEPPQSPLPLSSPKNGAEQCEGLASVNPTGGAASTSRQHVSPLNQHRRARSLQMSEPSRYNHFLPRKVPSKSWVKVMRSARLDGCMDAYLFEEHVCSDNQHDHRTQQHSHNQWHRHRHRHQDASKADNSCCKPRYLSRRQHAQDMIDVDRHFIRLHHYQDFDDDGPPPWSPTFRATAAANSRTSANASSPYRHVPACDDLRRRSNWRHQILFSGHGRDACGHFGIRGTLSERTGLIRFIKTYYVPPHGQESPQALSNDMNGNGNTAMTGASVTNQTAWSEGYDGRDPLKRTPGQWVFPEDSTEDEFDGNGDDKVENNGDSNRRSGTEEDDYFAGNDTPNSEETDDFWDVDTFGWCYRGYLDDGGEDGGLDDSNDGNCHAMNGCEDRKRTTKPSPISTMNDNGHGDGGGDSDDVLPVGGVGILGKWCDMHGGGPFWLFHRDLYDEFN